MQQLLFAPFVRQREPGASSDNGNEKRKSANMSIKEQMNFPKERVFIIENPNRE